MTQSSSGISAIFSLYRQILRTHRKVLPPPLRPVGDAYVKDEFRQHLRSDVSQSQWQEFVSQWMRYCSMLEGTSDLPVGSGEIPTDVMDSMNADQQRKLDQIKRQAQQFGSELWNK